MKIYSLTKQDKELIDKAVEATKIGRKLKRKDFGDVGAALKTSDGNFFTGISLGHFCGIGSCGEYQAIGAMITGGETKIDTIVASHYDGKIIPPCGKCREMISQTDVSNKSTWVIVSKNRKVKLKDLLPLDWQEVFK